MPIRDGSTVAPHKNTHELKIHTKPIEQSNTISPTLATPIIKSSSDLPMQEGGNITPSISPSSDIHTRTHSPMSDIHSGTVTPVVLPAEYLEPTKNVIMETYPVPAVPTHPHERERKPELPKCPTHEPIPHHVSDVDSWGGHPDRNYFTFVAISVIFGFLGLDHFYLRSFGTGTQKFFVNVTTLGSWYIWDLIQIFADGKKIRSDGLNSPLDWMRGIGRGVFVDPMPILPSMDGSAPKDTQSFSSKKSYLVYAFLAIFFGWLGADKFYMGELWQGLAKLLSCFNIFLFLFGWIWVFWDSFHAFFLTDSILKHGISAPMPYNILFKGKIPGEVFKVNMKTEELAKMQWKGLFGFPLSFSDFCSWFKIPMPTFPVREMYKDVIAPLLTPPILRAIKAATVVQNPVATPASAMPPTPAPTTSFLPSITEYLPSSNQIHNTAVQTADTARESIASLTDSFMVVSKGVTDGFAKLEEVPKRKTEVVQSGGARFPDLPMENTSSDGPGAVIAGALTAVVAAGGLKGFYDIISKQYG